MNYTMMNIEMTKATLDCHKTQTRRVVKSHLKIHSECTFSHKCSDGRFRFNSDDGAYFCIIKSKYRIGEIIWAREPARVVNIHGVVMDVEFVSDETKLSIKIPKRFYKAQAGCSIINYSKWISACKDIPNGCIKEMARIFLRITNVRVEKLQDITYEDILKEGCPLTGVVDALAVRALGVNSDVFQWFIKLWNSTAQKGYKWEDNPYVFVNEFESCYKKC